MKPRVIIYKKVIEVLDYIQRHVMSYVLSLDTNHLSFRVEDGTRDIRFRIKSG
jgi:hypothetical protein